MNKSLAELYDDIKASVSNEQPSVVNTPPMKPEMWKAHAGKECEKLKDNCAKKVLIDIYYRILPLDSNYVAANPNMVKGDIDKFLTNKNMSAAQYITSGHERTKAPLFEYLIRSINMIGKEFLKEADETLKDAKEKNIDVPPPIADDEKVDSQLVDVTDDIEYTTFIDELKQKTIDKIVNDVSEIINNSKEESDMTFDSRSLKSESTVAFIIDHVHKNLWKENVEFSNEIQEQIIGLAIRESTLNLIDRAFEYPYSDYKQFTNRIHYGKSALIDESAIDEIVNFDASSYLEAKEGAVYVKGRDAGFRTPGIAQIHVKDYVATLKSTFGKDFPNLQSNKHCAVCANRTIDKVDDAFITSCTIGKFDKVPYTHNIECDKFQ